MKELFNRLSNRERYGLLMGIYPTSLNAIHHCTTEEILELITYAYKWKLEKEANELCKTSASTADQKQSS